MIQEVQESWLAFACSCIGGRDRARRLVLDACAILHAEKDDAARAELYRHDARFNELKDAIARSHLMLGIADDRDALSCVRWIMRSCFFAVQESEARR